MPKGPRKYRDKFWSRIMGRGNVVIAPNSGLRKRMRAARRGKLPDDILQKIDLAMSEKALMRHKWYRKKTLAAAQ